MQIKPIVHNTKVVKRSKFPAKAAMVLGTMLAFTGCQAKNTNKDTFEKEPVVREQEKQTFEDRYGVSKKTLIQFLIGIGLLGGMIFASDKFAHEDYEKMKKEMENESKSNK